jgi:hypothetical protein
MRRSLAVLSLLLAASVSAQTYRVDAIRAHMKFLASDLLEGRGTGTRGHQLAAEYVATQFESYGLEPGGTSATYFQSVPFRKTLSLPESTMTMQRGKEPAVTSTLGTTFMTSGNPLADRSTIEGDVVFAGFGITAPESKYDDYKGIDVKGKIVLVFNGAPEAFPNTLRAHYSSSYAKLDNAVAHGAIGAITMGLPDEYRRVAWDRVVRQTKLGAMHWLNAAGEPHAVFSAIPVTFSLSRPGAEAFFGSTEKYEQAARSLAEGKARRGPIGVHVKFDVRSEHTRVESPNVVGIVRGSDPVLRNESIVITSHLDHLGISDPVRGDSINNGALDNASGIAVILEMARVLAMQHPRRSVVFVATTAEEKGLRGADYYANNPTVPFESIVANVNIDEVYMFAPTKDLTIIGAENSDLGAASERVAAAMGIELSPDPFPEEVVFVRSDQYPFVRRGIPAIFPIAGNRPVDPKTDVKGMQAAWNVNRYHQPSDDMNQSLDFGTGVQMADFGTRVVLDIANRDERPQWNRGNFFGERFGRK